MPAHGRTVDTPDEVLTTEFLSQAFEVPVHVMVHHDYGTPLVLPDGLSQKR
jgi:ABC-type hemin transport system ATPase subunit